MVEVGGGLYARRYDGVLVFGCDGLYIFGWILLGVCMEELAMVVVFFLVGVVVGYAIVSG